MATKKRKISNEPFSTNDALATLQPIVYSFPNINESSLIPFHLITENQQVTLRTQVCTFVQLNS